MFDQLESRRLLSSSIQVSSALGVLQIVGTDAADDISVSIERWSKSLGNAQASVTVQRDGKVMYSAEFDSGALTAVQIWGNAGDDSIVFDSSNGMVSAEIFGGDGNDTIQATIAQDALAPSVYAGDGNDLITLENGAGSHNGFVAFGEGGNDVILGSSSGDTLYGDWLTPYRGGPIAGDDVIYGGAGDDKLFGGQGDDYLIAEEGNDYLSGDDGRDVLDGGEGFDTANSDGNDVLSGIELVSPKLGFTHEQFVPTFVSQM